MEDECNSYDPHWTNSNCHQYQRTLILDHNWLNTLLPAKWNATKNSYPKLPRANHCSNPSLAIFHCVPAQYWKYVEFLRVVLRGRCNYSRSQPSQAYSGGLGSSREIFAPTLLLLLCALLPQTLNICQECKYQGQILETWKYENISSHHSQSIIT